MSGKSTVTPTGERTKPLLAELRQLLLEFEDDVDWEEAAGWAQVESICDRLKSWYCKNAGHVWTVDQCGYWQHQICVFCHEAKYPAMAKRSCRDLTDEMGETTEEEFLSANSELSRRGR